MQFKLFFLFFLFVPLHGSFGGTLWSPLLIDSPGSGWLFLAHFSISDEHKNCYFVEPLEKMKETWFS